MTMAMATGIVNSASVSRDALMWSCVWKSPAADTGTPVDSSSSSPWASRAALMPSKPRSQRVLRAAADAVQIRSVSRFMRLSIPCVASWRQLGCSLYVRRGIGEKRASAHTWAISSWTRSCTVSWKVAGARRLRHSCRMSGKFGGQTGHRHFRFWENYERRVLQPEGWALPRSQMAPRWLEWFRYRAQPASECAFLNAGLATILIDTLCWPAAWLHHVEERYIAPSLDLTVWFHRPAPAGWLLVDAESPVAQGGLIAGAARVFDEQRNLVASGGSALLCVPLSK